MDLKTDTRRVRFFRPLELDLIFKETNVDYDLEFKEHFSVTINSEIL
jgi:hypothetical protein